MLPSLFVPDLVANLRSLNQDGVFSIYSQERGSKDPELSESEQNMETQLERLEIEAMKLSVTERAALARMLLESLDEDPELDEAWAAEADKRMSEVDRGESKLVPMEEALARVRAHLTSRPSL